MRKTKADHSRKQPSPATRLARVEPVDEGIGVVSSRRPCLRGKWVVGEDGQLRCQWHLQ